MHWLRVAREFGVPERVARTMLSEPEFQRHWAFWRLEPTGFESRLLCDIAAAIYNTSGVEHPLDPGQFMPEMPLGPDAETLGNRIKAAVTRPVINNGD